ncbi:hypothetical protein CA600_06330 [Paenibacillus sp. VTT E-133280]|uniref:Mu transposase C-terminal domain-containing protein n=1 Tax=Paenibacillus sp. VTT E-133280 TaxID=1986222 RepID=UPI000BA14019|nr:Mu transposase C-terminal domain-containing protein [Paenibacillus sp. VTT E-133280]OZQ68425.1 hypothetical protein CA600_06330 [Paenibacillus sp. VTT E-133280]
MKRIMIDVGTHQKMRYKIIRKSYTPDQESECVYTALAEAFNVEREFTSDEILELLNTMDSSRLILLSKNDKTVDEEIEINDYESMTENEKAAAEKRLKCIEPLLENDPNEPSFPKRVNQRVAELKNQGIKTSRTRLYHWLKEYVDSENDIRSLIDDNNKKGPQERLICEEVRNVTTDILKKYYLVKEKRSIPNIHKLILAKLHHINEVKVVNGEPVLKMPSLRTLYRVVSEISKYEIAKKQYGKLYVQTKMGYFGVMEKPTRPLEIVQMDSTPIDVILVDDETRLPLPRAHLTVAVDMKTRYVVGVNIGMDSPGYVTTMLTLRNTICKKNIKEKYPYLKNDWLANGLPETILLDNGKEFRNKSLRLACDQLGIKYRYCKTKHPYSKGIVERFLQTANYQTAHQIPGTTFSNTKIRNDKEYDSDKKAVMGLNTFMKIFFEWLLDVYSIRFHEGIENFPLELWKEGVKKDPPQQYKDMFELSIILFPYKKRTVQNHGIQFRRLKYYSPELWNLKLERLRLGLDNEVIIKYDPDDISKIYVLDDTNVSKKYLTVLCLDQEYSKGLSLAVHLTIRDEIKNIRRQEDVLTQSLAIENVIDYIEADQKKHKKIKRDQAKATTKGSNATSKKTQKEVLEDKVKANQERMNHVNGNLVYDDNEDWGDAYYDTSGE